MRCAEPTTHPRACPGKVQMPRGVPPWFPHTPCPWGKVLLVSWVSLSAPSKKARHYRKSLDREQQSAGGLLQRETCPPSAASSVAATCYNKHTVWEPGDLRPVMAEKP